MKRIQQVKDIRDISMRSVGARCVPKAHRSGYLELFTFEREKEGLEKDMFGVGKRKDCIQKRLDDISKWMNNLRKDISGGQKTGVVKPAHAGLVKILAVKY